MFGDVRRHSFFDVRSGWFVADRSGKPMIDQLNDKAGNVLVAPLQSVGEQLLMNLLRCPRTVKQRRNMILLNTEAKEFSQLAMMHHIGSLSAVLGGEKSTSRSIVTFSGGGVATFESG